VVTGMTINPTAQAGTALSPEWDRGFDEAFTELISGDPDLVRAEFDALIGANYTEPPTPPAPPVHSPPAPPSPGPDQPGTASTVAHEPGATSSDPRPPP
jgi:hypothetical protein